MADILQEFMKSMGPQVARQLSSNLPVNKRTAQQMIPAIAPLILGGLKKQMQEKGGAPRVDHILNKYGKKDNLDHMGELFSSKAREDNPDPKLGGLLGDSGVQAAEQLAGRFNIDANTVMKIIPMLAPIVLGFLSQKRDNENLGTDGIASLIDRDGDGQVLDDVAGFLMNSLSSRSGGGTLGRLLGGFLGGGRG